MRRSRWPRTGPRALWGLLLGAALLCGAAACSRTRKPPTRDGALETEAQAAASAPEPPLALPDFRSRRLTGPVQIDGALGEWTRIPATRVADGPNVVMQARPWKGPRDLSFRARFAHDDQALYVAVEVDDDVVVAPPPPEPVATAAADGGVRPAAAKPVRRRSLSRLDHVELWLAHPEIREPGLGERYALRLAISPHGEVQILAPREAGTRARNIEAAGRIVPGGYVVEARLPLAVLEPLPRPELERLAVLVDVVDVDEMARPARDRMMSSSSARKPDDLTTFGKLTFEAPGLKAAPLARWSQHPAQHLPGGWRRGRDGTWFFACHHPDRPAPAAGEPGAGRAAEADGPAPAAGSARGRRGARGRGRDRRGARRPPAGGGWATPKVKESSLVRLGAGRVRLQLLISPCDGSAVVAAWRDGEETAFSVQKLSGQPVGEAGEARRGLLRTFQLPDETPAVALRMLKQEAVAAGAARPAATPTDGGPAGPAAAPTGKSALTAVIYALHDDGLSPVWEHELSRHEPGQPGFRCDFKITGDRQGLDYRCSEGRDPAIEASAGTYRWDGAQYVFDRATGAAAPVPSAPSPSGVPTPAPPRPSGRAVPGAAGLPHIEPPAPPPAPPSPPAAPPPVTPAIVPQPVPPPAPSAPPTTDD